MVSRAHGTPSLPSPYPSPSRIERIPSFRSEELDNERDLYVYLPPGYEEESGRRYPVLYAHDGQNAFQPAYNGKSWHLDRACDELIAAGRIEPPIVVAIANRGSDRNEEYAHDGPHADQLGYACRGEAYERFLVREAKPYIDARYRTRPGPESTALLGSSRGGLVTYHIGSRHPETFGLLAMLSPYFAQYDDETMTHLPMACPYAGAPEQRIWIDAGGMEGMTVQVPHVRAVVRALMELGYAPGERLMYLEEPEASHDEEAWADRVRSPLLWLFGRIGRPVEVRLAGADAAGVRGAAAELNPIVEYDSGFRMTDLAAGYRVEPPELAAVRPDGRVEARRPGACVVHYEGRHLPGDGAEDDEGVERRNGTGKDVGAARAKAKGADSVKLAASKELRIEEELPERVSVSVEVKVPANTPEDARIYAPFELHRVNLTTYAREVRLPRGSGFAFYVSEHGGLLETGEGGDEPLVRRFRADRQLRLTFEVREWLSRSGF